MAIYLSKDEISYWSGSKLCGFLHITMGKWNNTIQRTGMYWIQQVTGGGVEILLKWRDLLCGLNKLITMKFPSWVIKVLQSSFQHSSLTVTITIQPVVSRITYFLAASKCRKLPFRWCHVALETLRGSGNYSLLYTLPKRTGKPS